MFSEAGSSDLKPSKLIPELREPACFQGLGCSYAILVKETTQVGKELTIRLYPIASYKYHHRQHQCFVMSLPRKIP